MKDTKIIPLGFVVIELWVVFTLIQSIPILKKSRTFKATSNYQKLVLEFFAKKNLLLKLCVERESDLQKSIFWKFQFSVKNDLA